MVAVASVGVAVGLRARRRLLSSQGQTRVGLLGTAVQIRVDRVDRHLQKRVILPEGSDKNAATVVAMHPLDEPVGLHVEQRYEVDRRHVAAALVLGHDAEQPQSLADYSLDEGLRVSGPLGSDVLGVVVQQAEDLEQVGVLAAQHVHTALQRALLELAVPEERGQVLDERDVNLGGDFVVR